MANETTTFEQKAENLENEKKLFFDTAYRAYTRLAEIADEADEPTRRRIQDAISELGLVIGRAEPREHRRE